MATNIYLLNAPGCSGRAVKIRELSSDEVDKCAVMASKTLTSDATNMEFSLAKHGQMNRRAVVGVTEAGGFKAISDVPLDQICWHVLTQQELELPGKYAYTSLFNAKDDAVISGITQRLHTISA